MKRYLSAVAALSIVGACGGEPEQTPEQTIAGVPVERAPAESGTFGQAEGPQTEDRQSDATTAAADIKKPSLDCTEVKARTDAAAGRAKDIVGIQIGDTPDQVRKVLECANSGYVIQGPELRPVGTPLQNSLEVMVAGGMQASNGLDSINVQFSGYPGEEVAMVVQRTVQFAEGARPSIDRFTTELQRKYGPLYVRMNDHKHYLAEVAYWGSGKQLTEDALKFDPCATQNLALEEQLLSETKLNTDELCGVMVGLVLFKPVGDPTIVTKFSSTLSDLSRVYDITFDAERQFKAKEAERAKNESPLDL